MTRTDDTEIPDYSGKLRLDGRNFVVIGAGQGIGRQATHALASLGARTFCVDLDHDLADDIAKEVDGIAWSGDATKRDDAESLFAAVLRTFGWLECLVSNAGIYPRSAVTETSAAERDAVLGTTLRGTFHHSRPAAPPHSASCDCSRGPGITACRGARAQRT